MHLYIYFIEILVVAKKKFCAAIRTTRGRGVPSSKTNPHPISATKNTMMFSEVACFMQDDVRLRELDSAAAGACRARQLVGGVRVVLLVDLVS